MMESVNCSVLDKTLNLKFALYIKCSRSSVGSERHVAVVKVAGSSPADCTKQTNCIPHSGGFIIDLKKNFVFFKIIYSYNRFIYVIK